MIKLLLSETEMESFGYDIGKTLKGGEILLLNGELGSGKTVFTKGIARALDIKENIVSPTFTLLNIYKGSKLFLYHYDVYRLSSSLEAEENGLDEFFNNKDNVCVIEWAKNIEELVSNYNVMRFDFNYKGEHQREVIYQMEDKK